jgi:XTP/dITP diphosphohydrolase
VKLLVATNNRGKVAELLRLLDLPGLELVTPSEAGLAPDYDVEETGTTFKENAVLKAEQYARAAQLHALADDSGLEVDALGGQPGVYSKRFAGEDATDQDRINFLLAKLPDLPDEQLTARFVAAIAFAGPDGRILRIEEGYCEGYITRQQRGTGGFGYDPIFVVKAAGQTLAELSPSAKNAHSHRGNGIAKIRPFIQQYLQNQS